EYTGLAPRLLTNAVPAEGAASDTDAAAAAAAPVEVPAGSLILAQINDGEGEPALTLGEETLALRAVAERAWRIELTADTGGAALRSTQLTVSQNDEPLGSWPFTIVADTAPVI
ncbi:MAG: DUF4175 family protein, partial [Alphaproteobacteria bacterium]